MIAVIVIRMHFKVHCTFRYIQQKFSLLTSFFLICLVLYTVVKCIKQTVKMYYHQFLLVVKKKNTEISCLPSWCSIFCFNTYFVCLIIVSLCYCCFYDYFGHEIVNVIRKKCILVFLLKIFSVNIFIVKSCFIIILLCMIPLIIFIVFTYNRATVIRALTDRVSD